MRRIRVQALSTTRRCATTYMHMTALAVRYETGQGRRFVRHDESRKAQMDELRELIERDDYDVDPRKVAEAIVARLMARR